MKYPDNLKKGDIGAGTEQSMKFWSTSSPWLQGPAFELQAPRCETGFILCPYSVQWLGLAAWSALTVERILRLGLCSAGKKWSDWLIMHNKSPRMEGRATLLAGSCRTCWNSFFLENVRTPQVGKAKLGLFMSKSQNTEASEPLAAQNSQGWQVRNGSGTGVYKLPEFFCWLILFCFLSAWS